MKVHEIMTAHARCVSPDNTLVEAAGLMRELDVGSLPVCENDRLMGIVTDRDMALRGIAEGKDPNTTPISEVMTKGVVYAFADQAVEEVVRLMEGSRIRRVPVLNRGKRLVGIVSLGDIAISSNPAFSGLALRDVSEPREPNARQRRLSQQSEPRKIADLSALAPRGAGEGSPDSRNVKSATRRPSPKKKSKTARSPAKASGTKRKRSNKSPVSATKKTPGRTPSPRARGR